MKKIIILAALAIGAMTANAQVTVQGSKFSDNWSLGLKGGAVSPFEGSGFWKNSRGIVGLELTKQVTPVLGLGVEGEWTINTSSWSGSKSANAFDHQYVGVFGTLNMMNIFAGYKGAPRPFEIEAVAGTGWLHSYYPNGNDGNSWGTKVGLNFNFNLGEAKAWTISLKPAILWNMNASVEPNNLGYSARYNSNHAYVEMQAGVTYHFKNSNGTHHFKVVRPMDEEEIAALNAQINSLRQQLDDCGADRAALQSKINSLQQQLDDCLSRPAVVKEVVKNLDNVRYVFFRQGSSVIDATQKPNVEMVAESLKKNSGSTVCIKGYASPEGSKAFNDKLAQKRADVVKRELVKNYGIAEDRINAQGEGVGSVFSEKTWNRVAICTIDVK